MAFTPPSVHIPPPDRELPASSRSIIPLPGSVGIVGFDETAYEVRHFSRLASPQSSPEGTLSASARWLLPPPSPAAPGGASGSPPPSRAPSLRSRTPASPLSLPTLSSRSRQGGWVLPEGSPAPAAAAPPAPASPHLAGAAAAAELSADLLPHPLGSRSGSAASLDAATAPPPYSAPLSTSSRSSSSALLEALQAGPPPPLSRTATPRSIQATGGQDAQSTGSESPLPKRGVTWSDENGLPLYEVRMLFFFLYADAFCFFLNLSNPAIALYTLMCLGALP